ncbi:MAG: hypothetical protein KGN76_15445 [Acidobacteriota bacterium]|nr:hypothetical protein [Acidobacteriota bacterium]
MSVNDPLLAPMPGADHREVGGVQHDVVRAGDGRVKRTIYPAGFQWQSHMKGVVGTELCMHAHVGFLARGRIQIRYPDGCTLDLTAPQAVVLEPGHVGSVVGSEPAVLIEFDFEKDTVSRFGLAGAHRH